MSSTPTLEQIQVYLGEFGLMNQLQSERQAVVTAIPTQHGPQLGYLRIDEEREVVTLRVPGIFQVVEARRAEVAKGIGMINYFLVLGKFALDLRDGELAFDLPILCAEVGLQQSHLARAFAALVATFNVHLPQLSELVWSERSRGDPHEVSGTRPGR